MKKFKTEFLINYSLIILFIWFLFLGFGDIFGVFSYNPLANFILSIVLILTIVAISMWLTVIYFFKREKKKMIYSMIIAGSFAIILILIAFTIIMFSYIASQ